MINKRIILHKNQLLYDIEGLAYKYTEAAGLEPKPKNVVAADHNEELDGRLLHRKMDLRDAKLRMSLRFCLKSVDQEWSCDDPDTADEYVYNVSVQDTFDGNVLPAIKTLMHEYIVKGTLYDWYTKMGIQTTAVTLDEVEKLEEQAVSMLRGRSYLKAPMQPFGPRN